MKGCRGTGIRPPDGKDQMGLPRWGPETMDNRVDRSCSGCSECQRSIDGQVISKIAARELARSFWELRIFAAPSPLPNWLDLSDEERSKKIDNAEQYLRGNILLDDV